MKSLNKRIVGIGAILLICTLFIIPVSAADAVDEDYWLYTGVTEYLSKGKYQEAIEAFDKVVSINPDNAAAYHNKGVALYQLGEYEKALEQFRLAMSNIAWFGNPYSRGYLWEYTGKTLDELDRQNDAIPAYEESLRFAPMKAEVWALLVQDLQLTGDYDSSDWIQENVFVFYDNGTITADAEKGKEYLSTRIVHNTSAYYGEETSGQSDWLVPTVIGVIVIIVVAGAFFHYKGKNE